MFMRLTLRSSGCCLDHGHGIQKGQSKYGVCSYGFKERSALVTDRAETQS